jgi:hypothetical protein
MGLGTSNPNARMQINHKAGNNSPSFLILDSITGTGPSIRFQRLGLDSFFSIGAQLNGPQSNRGFIFSWRDDSLLWVKSDGRMGLGTSNPNARMQINHKANRNSPSFLILDSLTGSGPSIQFRKMGSEAGMFLLGDFGTHEVGHAMVIGWRDDSLLWVRDNGRMGIGTGNPLAKMQVNNTSTNLRPGLLLVDSAGGNGNYMNLARQGQTTLFKMLANPSNNVNNNSFGIITNLCNCSGDSLLWFRNNRMGIFTGNPQFGLDINTTVNVKNLVLNGNQGQPGQVLTSNGVAGPPTWNYPDTIDIDTISFKSFSAASNVPGGNTLTITSTTEKFDFGNIHNPGTGITTIDKEGIYLFTIRASFTTNSSETGPFQLRVALEVLNPDNSVAETIDETSVLPGGMGAHTSQVSLHTQLLLESGKKLRVKLSNSRPAGAVNSKLEEFAGTKL